MPTRKSGSSETTTQSDSRRSSLRRLSSIASFQTLFSRRRSNNATDHTAASSSSTLSLASTTGHAPVPSSFLNISTNSLQAEDTVSDLPPPLATHHPARRSSYICLPDDPIGSMPRSRTFSNLPLPTRARKANPIVPSKSHSRLPSAIFPSSRLPSPQMSTRKHSLSRLASTEAKAPPIKNRMMRSDTEPLLGVNAPQSSLLPRSTAFKENISLSPVKPLPALDMSNYRQKYPSPLPNHPYGAYQLAERRNDRQPSFGLVQHPSSPPLPQHQKAPKIPTSREHRSSPIPANTRDRRPPSFTHVQRFNSQPVLTTHNNFHNRRDSQHGEVKQTRLMSAKQPPTPPLPKTPLRTSQSRTTTAVSGASKSTPHVTQSSNQNTNPSQPPPRHPTIAPSSPPKSVHQIRTSEPPPYWSGRLCALLDRYRNEELALHTTTTFHTPKAQTDKMHTPEASTARIHRAFEHLHSLCVEPAAKESLTRFQCQYAEVMGMPELRRMAPIVLGSASGSEAGGGGRDEEAAMGMSETRKMEFMDRLLGRQKRRSLVMV